MLALPLTGWALVSLRHGPIGFWGLHFPHLPGVGFLAGQGHKPLRQIVSFAHTHILVYIVLADLFLHVSGALKHQFDGHPVLWRMTPFFKAPRT